jgi:AcrR family transcriptional regulator
MAARAAPAQGRTARSAERRAAILEAAAGLFYERSFAAVSVDEIARRIGVTAPALYRHFLNKDEILSALFEEGMDEVVRVTSGSFDDPVDELGHLAREHARHVLSRPHLANVWMHEDRSLVEPYRRRYLRRASRYIDRWQACVALCHPDAAAADVRAAVHAVLGMLNALPSRPEEGLAVEELIALAEDMVQLALEPLSAG